MSVEYDIELLPADRSHKLEKGECLFAVVVIDHLVDARIAFDDLGCITLDQECNTNGGRVFLEDSRHRERENHIPDSIGADDQNAAEILIQSVGTPVRSLNIRRMGVNCNGLKAAVVSQFHLMPSSRHVL